MFNRIIAVTNQKGGVGKTTTTINLAHGLALKELKVLVVDLDPQGNATQALGVPLESIAVSIGDLILNKEVPMASAIYKSNGLDLIPATPVLSSVQKEMVGITNSEFRLKKRLNEIRKDYSIILIDTPPTLGPLMNSALNAAESLIIPVDSYFAMMGIKGLLSEVEEIRAGTNPDLNVLGYLITLLDHTKLARVTGDSLTLSFPNEVFKTKIRKNVKLKESPALGKTIFDYAPDSMGAEDYFSLSEEVIERLTGTDFSVGGVQ